MERLLERDLRENSGELRRLFGTELLFDYEAQRKCFLFSQAVIINSKIDLFSNIDNVEKAIFHWKMLHPLLRCRITSNGSQKYFQYASKETIMSTSNVSYITYKSNAQSAGKNYWKLLLEREFNQGFDSENGPLWRLVLLQLEKDENNNNNNYCLIFSMHHALTDCKNAYAIIAQLCGLIEKAFENRLADVTEDDYLNSKKEINYPHDPRLIAEQKGDSPERMQDDYNPNIRVPNFSKPSPNCHNKSSKSTSNEIDDDGVFYTLDNRVFATAKELIHESDCVNNTGIRTMSLPNELYRALLEHCKSNSVKFNSILSLATSIALAKMFKKFSDEHAQEPFRMFYSITVNLRQTLEMPMTLVGSWINRFYDYFAINADDKFDEHFFKSKFWQLAKEHSEQFHQRLASNEHILSLKEPLNFYRIIEKGFRFQDLSTHYSLSNIGILPNRNGEDSPIVIKECYSGLSFKSEGSYSYTQHCWATIDEKLFGCLSYSGATMKEEVADYLMQSLMDTLSQIAAAF